MSFGDQLLGAYIETKYQTLERRTVCPNCATPLRESERGLFCPFGDWHESPQPPKFIPRVPTSNK